MNLEHLRALGAVLKAGSFDAAAAMLSITPSAVSQRIKALETSVGQVLVLRRSPVTATKAGQILQDMAGQIAALEADAWRSLGREPEGPTILSIAVTDNCLGTWFRSVLHDASKWNDISLNIRTVDSQLSSRLLQNREIIGAVTTNPSPISGCHVENLGHQRYRPAASQELIGQYSTPTGPGWSTMPRLRLRGDNDPLHRFLVAHKVGGSPLTHLMDTQEGLLQAVEEGLGWGMVPEARLPAADRKEPIELLDGEKYIEVPLYWQSWKLESEPITRLAKSISRASPQH